MVPEKQQPALKEMFSAASVRSRNAIYSDAFIEAPYEYSYVEVDRGDPINDSFSAISRSRSLIFRTECRVPKMGIMLVGLGGNNGTTFVAGVLANRQHLVWRTKSGIKKSNWYGSLMLASTSRLGVDRSTGNTISVPLSSMLPMIHPDSLVIGGWDISSLPLGDAMRRASVIDIALQDLLYDEMQQMHPLPAIYHPQYIADNQKERADNLLLGTLQQQLDAVRQNIRDFRIKHSLDEVIVVWTATTERFTDVTVSQLLSIVMLLFFHCRKKYMTQKRIFYPLSKMAIRKFLLRRFTLLYGYQLSTSHYLNTFIQTRPHRSLTFSYFVRPQFLKVVVILTDLLRIPAFPVSFNLPAIIKYFWLEMILNPVKQN